MNFESVESFVARGGPIQRLAPGESGEANLTGKQRVNPDRSITNAEREARRLAAQAVPIPHSRLSKDRPASNPKQPGKPGPESKRNARKNAILAELVAGPVSPKYLAGVFGIHENQVSVYLRRLLKEGRVIAHGSARNRRWGLPCP